jgi:beta-lactamase regulating signal transducer with metallopeptidase domain
MLMRPDGQPGPSRHALGLIGSLAIHVVVMAALLSWAGAGRQADPVNAGRSTGQDTPRLSPAAAPPGLGGGGGAEPKQLPPAELSAARPVGQAEPPGLQVGIGPIIDHVWHSTLFAIGAALLTLAFRRNRARLRYALWFSASVKFLVPFSLIVWLGSFMASCALAFLGTSESPGVAGSLGPPRPIDTLDNPSIGRSVEDLTQHPVIGGLSRSLAQMGTAALWPSTFTIKEIPLTWLSLAPLAIWTCGFYAVVASRIRRSRQHWDVVLTSRRVELLDVQVPARLQVALADELLEPGVIGWMHPVLLLPADIERHLTRPEIEAIIAHELCHIRRFDNMTAATHMMVEAIFWFHPLVWWIGTWLLDERERACDEYVLRTVDAPGPYAQGILSICERYVPSPLASVCGVRSANLRQRIDAILANRVGETAGVWKKLILSAVVICAVIVPLVVGAMQPGAADGGRVLCPQLVGHSETMPMTRGSVGSGKDQPMRGRVNRCASDPGDR